MRTSCPYSVSGRYDDGDGYGHSSQLMLPGLTSVGVGTAGAVCACATAGRRSRARTSAFIMRVIINHEGRPVEAGEREATVERAETAEQNKSLRTLSSLRLLFHRHSVDTFPPEASIAAASVRHASSAHFARRGKRRTPANAVSAPRSSAGLPAGPATRRSKRSASA